MYTTHTHTCCSPGYIQRARESGHQAATQCNTVQHTATNCNTLQHTSTHLTSSRGFVRVAAKLQYTATLCNTLQHSAKHGEDLISTVNCITTLTQHTTSSRGFMRVVIHCNTLQHSATLCNTLYTPHNVDRVRESGDTLRHSTN